MRGAAKHAPSTASKSRFLSWATAAGGRVLRLFGGSRVLQVEEVRVGLSEHLETQALRGLRQRYLPSRVSISVSEEDHRCLQPFSETISQMTQEEARRRILGTGWRATADRIDFDLLVDPALQTGEAPRVTSTYPAGVRNAGWSWLNGDGHDPSTTERIGPEAGCIRLTMTATQGEGTALQEELWLVLDPKLTLRALDPELPPVAHIVLSQDGTSITDHTGTPWSTPGNLQFEIRSPLIVAATEGPEVPADWNRPWAEFTISDGRRLIWCPGGVAVIGRLKEHAHVVPLNPPPSVSRQQVRLRRGGDGRLQITDMGTTNGTWLDKRKLQTLEDRVVSLPAQVRVGSKGLFVVEIR